MMPFEILRATNHENYKQFVLEESYHKNTAFIALNKNNDVIASASYIILNQKLSELKSLNLYQTCDEDALTKAFHETFLYWNPFIQKIHHHKTYINEDSSPLYKVSINDISVEQLSINEVKLENTLLWIQKEEDVIINLIQLDGKYVLIDGYSRLMAAYLKGFKEVYGFIEKDEFDEKDFRVFLQWCEDEDIHHIKDLKSRIVRPDEHQKIWIDRCQAYFKNKHS